MYTIDEINAAYKKLRQESGLNIQIIMNHARYRNHIRFSREQWPDGYCTFMRWNMKEGETRKEAAIRALTYLGYLGPGPKQVNWIM